MLSFNMGTANVSTLRGLLAAAIQRTVEGCTLESAGLLMSSPRAFRRVREVMLEAWVASMPEPEKASGNSDGKPKAFASTWIKAWGEAKENLTLSSDEWLDMTPRMVQELSRNRLESIRYKELFASNLVSNLVMFSARGPKQPFKPDHFMFHPYPAQEQEEGPVTGETLMRIMEPATRYKGKSN